MLRKTITLVAVTTALMIPSTAAFAANTARVGGTITSPESPAPVNGGDQGWGNCGHNSSGGNPHTGDAGNGGGNGGDVRSACIIDLPA